MAAKMRRLQEDALRQLLTEGGLRVTNQRMTVLRALAKLRVPISHPELTERLASEALDRATIYRNLLSLTEVGVLVRTQLGDSVWRYELPRGQAGEHGSHPHFICTECGDVACLPGASVSLRGQAARNQVTEIQLRGRCGECANA